MTGSILIADDQATNRIILKARLTEAAYRVGLVGRQDDLIQALRRDEPDVLLLSDDFGGKDGVRVLRQLRARPEFATLPVVFLSDGLNSGRRVQAVKAGADAVMSGVPDTPLLRARLRSLMRRLAKEAELQNSASNAGSLGFAEPALEFTQRPAQIALIASSLAEGLDWRNALTGRLRDRLAVLDPARALKDLGDMTPPDAIIVGDLLADPGSATQLICDLRSRPETLNAAMIFAQSMPDTQSAITALDHGVNDVIETGFEATEIAQILRRELTRKARDDTRRAELKDGVRLAHTDPLTGLHNRRSALRHLAQTMSQAEARQQSFAVMVLDLDRFKTVNDTHGHAAGDGVLMTLARRMQSALPQGGFMARIGGEEFLVVLPKCDLRAAQDVAERLRKSVSAGPVHVASDGTEVSMTVSIGMVLGGAGGVQRSAAELIELADRGLYASKAEGRDQITVYQSAA